MEPITDLSQALHEELANRNNSAPERTILESLLEIMFFCTLARDEREPIRFDITYLDPKNPDPNPPRRIRSDRWIFVRFTQPLNFDIASIAKVALATDHRTSLLLVYPDDSHTLKIWGFIDQGTDTYKFRSLESESGHECPGLFQVSAVDAGHLIVRISFEQIAEMRGNRLAIKPIPALDEGALPGALEPVFHNLQVASRSYLRSFGDIPDEDELHDYISEITLQSLRRLLLRIQGYCHGVRC